MSTAAHQTLAPPEARAVAPMAHSERSLAPDIARGGMLLFIAIANVATYLHGSSTDDYNHIADSSGADRVALFIEQLLIAERSRPMFAILYGFGIAVMASRMFARGLEAKGVRKVLRRRSWWLLAFGFVHAAFLFYGDILAPYGATGLVALGFVHLSDRALRRWMLGTLAYLVVIATPIMALFYSAGGSPPSPELPLYIEQIISGMIGSAAGSAVAVALAMFLPLVLVGMMLQRAGWIDHPGEHLPQLRRVFVSGMIVNVLSSLPIALIGLGAWHPSEPLHLVAIGLTVTGGMYAGLGYICGFALLAHRWRSRGRRGVPGRLAAVGERSLTNYLTQSIIMAPLLSIWGLGLGEDMGYLAAYGVAIGTWLATVVLATLMERAGKRGPFETLLRRLTYGRQRIAS